jgi:hypothetical protein
VSVSRALVLAALAALACGCVSSRGQRVRAAYAPGPARPRLAAVMWPTASGFIYCQRRLDDDARPIGVAGPCFRMDAGERDPHRIVSWASLGRFDGTPPNAGPWDRCHAELEDARPHEHRPARAWLVTPTGRTLVEEWSPEPELTGDVFTLELSFAPEGQWMAVEHVMVGLGEGERTVEVTGVALRPVPACR